MSAAIKDSEAVLLILLYSCYVMHNISVMYLALIVLANFSIIIVRFLIAVPLIIIIIMWDIVCMQTLLLSISDMHS